MTQINADSPSQSRVRECYETLFEEALTGKIIGAFFHVHNALGFGFPESVYKKALQRELLKRSLAAQREVAVEVCYEGEPIGIFRADLVVESRVVLEVKASRKLDTADTAQLLNYLRATDLELGLLLHFGPRASFKRLIATKGFTREAPVPRSSAPSAPSAAALFPSDAVAVPP